VPAIRADTVNAERVVGKPYLEIDIDREAIGRYGLNVTDVQDLITVAIGGRTVTTTVEGRERYPVRVRYPRELRTEIEDLKRRAGAGHRTARRCRCASWPRSSTRAGRR
jgi:copper/silver efflux system protein